MCSGSHHDYQSGSLPNLKSAIANNCLEKIGTELREKPIDIPVEDISYLPIIGKPDNLVTCKAINLYADRYRVNVYTKVDINGCEGQRITYSCFAKINKDLKVTIVDESPKISSGIRKILGNEGPKGRYVGVL